MQRKESFPLPVQQEDSANCADLPFFIYDKYFTAHPQRQPELAAVARAICSRCVIIEECRRAALNSPRAGRTGTIAGVAANQITTARSWIAFENGHRDTPPRNPRPDWLPERSEAAELAEQTRFELEEGVAR